MVTGCGYLMAKRRKKKTIKQLQEDLKKLLHKAPRTGVMPIKVHKDKSKYTRKQKHKKDYKDEA